eukprot:scaffold735_cov255-Pinguiococcus_pyrenoidosus.AAC.21
MRVLVAWLAPLLCPGVAGWHRPPARLGYQASFRPLFMSEVDVDPAEIVLEAESRMEKSLESVKGSLNTIRTGRASASLLDRVNVDYYGTSTPLKQLANIGVPSATQLTVDVYDKSSIADVERAIMESDVGLTPQNDGTIIRLNIPPLTEERRKELAKQTKAMGEDGKVALRNIRRDAVDQLKKLEKSGDISKDDSTGNQGDVQDVTDKFSKAIDEAVSKKEKEILTL